MNSWFRVLSASIAAFLLAPIGPAFGAPIASITDLNNFRDTRSLNDVNAPQGDVFQFGAQVVPNGAGGTRISAVQGSVNVPSTGSLPCGGFTVNPNFCALSAPFNASLSGPWNLTFTNGTNQATAQTPSPTTSALTGGAAPFPVSVTISGSGATPTLSWTVPSGFTPNAVRVQVFDKTATNQQGVDNIVFGTTFSGNATTFTVPATANLIPNNPYVLNIQLIETRDGTASSGSPNANISKRSSSFFDFTPLPNGAPPQVILPTVGPGLGAAYHFNAAGIVQGAFVFIDPFVALGYDYAIGQGDPNFASVLLPNLQNDPYLLSFVGEPGGNPVQLLGGQQFFFPAGGVGQFSVRGINAADNLDPGNVTAFITGLTFAGSGAFTGTMTPNPIQFVATPEPASLLLLAAGLAGLMAVTWRRRRQ